MNAAAHCMPLSLAPGAILRIDRGARIGLRAAAGLVWLTERGNLHDRVLAAGDSIRLSRNGRALVAASAPSRIVLEIPHDLDTTPRLEIAESEGGRGRELPIPQAASGRVARIRGAIADRIASLFESWERVERPPEGSVPDGALAIKLRSLRRQDTWHATGGVSAFAPRDTTFHGH